MNGKEIGKDQVKIETLNAGDETIAKQLAKLYTKCITERRIPQTWKEANMVILFKKGNRKDIKTTRQEKKLHENQPGFMSKYSTADDVRGLREGI